MVKLKRHSLHLTTSVVNFLDQLARWKWENWDKFSYATKIALTWNRLSWQWQLGQFGEGSTIYPHVAIYSPRLVKVGRRVNIVEFVHIWGGGGVEIGDNTIIASHSVITSQTHDKYARIFRESNIYKPVKIGSNCWIGAGAVILPGVTIGEGSIIGAQSVVTRDVPARVIVAGAPARIIEKLPPYDQLIHRSETIHRKNRDHSK